MEAQQISSDSPKALTAIDRALAAARARAAQRAAAAPTSDEAPPAKASKPKAEKQPREAKQPKAPKVVDASAKAAADEARAARKAQRDAERAARREAKAAAAASKTSHMKKVERAASKLPKLSQDVQQMLNSITGALGLVDMTTLAAHIQHHVRASATVSARGKRPEVGATIRVIGGDPKFVGMTGKVQESRPLRCFVEVAGLKKPLYLFNSEVEVVS